MMDAGRETFERVLARHEISDVMSMHWNMMNLKVLKGREQ